MLSRRGFIGGLFATAPVVIASSHLMPLRGVKFDPIVRVQSWPLGANVKGAFWVQEGPLSTMKEPMREMMGMFGNIHYAPVERAHHWLDSSALRDPQAPLGVGAYLDVKGEWFGGGGVFRVGIAHGVTREDKPTIGHDEFLQRVRERYSGWNARRQEEWSTDDEARLAAAHDAKTKALIAQADAIRTFGIPDQDVYDRLWKVPHQFRDRERARQVRAELGPPNPLRTRTRLV